MKLRIKRFDTSVPLPEYKTPGSAAMDLAVRIDATIAPGEILPLPLNVAIEPPKDHFVLMAPRSSLWKRGLQFANSIGIFDSDYSGDGDEYMAILRNFTDKPVSVKKGDRIAQIIVLPYDKVVWKEVKQLGNANRGGIGSTGI